MADLEYVRWIRRPELRRPHVVAAFTGWNDAADAASIAVKHLVEAMGATPLADIDPEEFTDFATIRPHVRLGDGLSRHIVWPTVSMWSVSGEGSDLILVLGPEPALRWKTFCRQIIGVAQTYKAASIMSLGALLADVPHRRPTQVIGTSPDETLIDRHDLAKSRYEGPTGIVGVLNDAATRAGIPTASLWAAVPAYAAQIPSPKAAAALIERLADIVDCDPLTLLLDAQVEQYEVQIDELINQDEQLANYLERLETLDDEEFEDDDEFSDDDATAETDVLSLSEESLDSDALMEEVERFLRSQRDD
ncbi:MAG: PAC2 family protein [Ilumatobacteraceae bacterium]